jgi:hypothetical protein
MVIAILHHDSLIDFFGVTTDPRREPPPGKGFQGVESYNGQRL